MATLECFFSELFYSLHLHLYDLDSRVFSIQIVILLFNNHSLLSIRAPKCTFRSSLSQNDGRKVFFHSIQTRETDKFSGGKSFACQFMSKLYHKSLNLLGALLFL